MDDLTNRETFDKMYAAFAHKAQERIKLLSDRDIRLASAYIESNGDLRSAAKSANIPERTARDIKKKPAFNDYVAYLKEQRRLHLESSLQLTWNYKAKKLHDIIEFWIDKPTAQLKAIEELNKMQGHYAPQRTENYYPELGKIVEDALDIAEKKPKVEPY